MKTEYDITRCQMVEIFEEPSATSPRVMARAGFAWRRVWGIFVDLALLYVDVVFQVSERCGALSARPLSIRKSSEKPR